MGMTELRPTTGGEMILTDDKEALRQFYRRFNQWLRDNGLVGLASHREYYLMREVCQAQHLKDTLWWADKQKGEFNNGDEDICAFYVPKFLWQALCKEVGL